MTSEKQGLEIGALNEFVEALVPVIGQGRFKFHRLLDPPEPDALCSFDGDLLHLEVAHVYGTKSDVKKLLGRKGKAAPTHAQQICSAKVPLAARLLAPLNDVLSNKATKRGSSAK